MQFKVLSSFFVLSLCLASCGKKQSVPTTVVDTGAVPGSIDEFAALGDRVYFSVNQSHLTEQSKDTLRRQAEWLKKYPNVNFSVNGHCDERGTVEYNKLLGARRALAVFHFLASQGISENRMKPVNLGKECPIVEGHDETAWAKNRVTITLLEKPGVPMPTPCGPAAEENPCNVSSCSKGSC